eukprot:2266541-Prymnesium_polylepis.1
MTGFGVFTHSLGAGLCIKTRSTMARSDPRAVGSAPTSKRPAPHGDVPTATSSSSAREPRSTKLS